MSEKSFNPKTNINIPTTEIKKAGNKLSSEFINNPKFNLDILKHISAQLKRDLNSSEQKFAINEIARIDFSKFPHDKLDLLKSRLVGTICYKLETTTQTRFDTREYQKRLIGGIQGSDDMISAHRDIFNPESHQPIRSSNPVNIYGPLEKTSASFDYPNYQFASSSGDKTIIPKEDDSKPRGTISGSVSKSSFISPVTNKQNRHIYLSLDTKNRNRSSSAQSGKLTNFSWIFTKTLDSKEGSVVCIAEDVNRIVSMGVNDIRLYYSAEADNMFKIITMGIKEFDSQSTIATSNWRYHFQFNVYQEGKTILLKNYREEDNVFEFPTPISQINTITLYFGSPFTTIPFEQDFYIVSIVPFDAVSSYVQFTSSPNINSGELLYFTGFSTGNSTQDAIIISQINSDSGFISTVIDTTTVSIPIDIRSVTFPLSVAECFIGSRRIFIRLRLEYIM
jgi:hypothetical protein